MDFIKKEQDKVNGMIKKEEGQVTGLFKHKPKAAPKKKEKLDIHDMKGMSNTLENGLDKISDPFDTTNRKPMFSIMGFSDPSVIDFWAGFWTGVFNRDVREEWHVCLGGPLGILKEFF